MAHQLNDLLQDRFKTFLYSKKQEELAGTDGELQFNAVFAEKARIVGVLYRPGWGETPWTRIEETAIRNRGFHEGYDFATFIALASPPAPRWLPKARIYFNFERFGPGGAAAVLAARVQEHGGESAEETVIERADRLKRSLDLEKKREEFRRSDTGVKAAWAAFTQMVEGLKSSAAELSERGLPATFRAAAHQHYLLAGTNVVLVVNWECHYANSLDGAKLHVDFFDKVPRLPGLMSFEGARTLDKSTYEFGLLSADAPGWRAADQKGYRTEAMHEHLLKQFLDLQEREKASR